MADEAPGATNWTVDVQRGLAWTIVLVFSLLTLAMAMRIILAGAPTDALELLKQLTNALINIAFAIVGFFYGSSKSSQSKDETQAKVAEKLAEKIPLAPAGPATTITTVPTEPSTTATTTTVTTEEPKP